MIGEIIGFLAVVLLGFVFIYPIIHPPDTDKQEMEATIEAKIEETMKLYKDQRNKELDHLHKEIQEMKLSMVTKIEEYLKSYKDQQSEDFHRNEGEDVMTAEVIKEKLQSVDEILEKIQAQLDGTHVQMETWKHDIVQSMEKFKSKLEEKIKSMDNNLTGVDGQVDLLFKELSDINTYIVSFSLLAVIGIVFGANKLLISNKIIGHVHGTSVQGLIIEELKRKTITKGILNISFDPSTRGFHGDVFNVVAKSGNLPLKDYMIRNYNHLLEVDLHKLVFIFVDANVLNTTETEAESIWRQSLEIFMKLECDVFVVYCKDNSSKDLASHDMCNPGLECIQHIPVISELKDKNRFLSIYDSLQAHQVECLSNHCKQLEVEFKI